MSADNEKLFAVAKHALPIGPVLQLKLFRTRAKARKYATKHNLKSKKFHYQVLPASWGPEA